MSNRKVTKKISSDDKKNSSVSSLKLSHKNKSSIADESSSSDKFKLILIPTALLTMLFASWYYSIWLASLVNTPLNEPKIIDEKSYKSSDNLDRFWGSYRFLTKNYNIIELYSKK
jgi:hypothetical protein